MSAMAVGAERFDALLADLAAQAAAHERQEVSAHVRALVQAEFARVDLASRLRAAVDVRLQVEGVGSVGGSVCGVDADTCQLVDERGHRWAIALSRVVAVTGIGGRSQPPSRIDMRLGWASLMRGWSDTGSLIRCWANSAPITGSVTRVGRDHFDLDILGPTPWPGLTGAGSVVSVAFGAVAGVQEQ